MSQQQNNSHSPNHSKLDYSSSERSEQPKGKLIYQTQAFTRQQMDDIYKHYKGIISQAPIVLFNDNDIDNARSHHTERMDFSGQAQVCGHYDKVFCKGITTTWYYKRNQDLNYNPRTNFKQFKKLMDTQFLPLLQYINIGRNIICPAPTENDLLYNGDLYYDSQGTLLFKHNIGTRNLPTQHLIYIQNKLDEIEKNANVVEPNKPETYNDISKDLYVYSDSSEDEGSNGRIDYHSAQKPQSLRSDSLSQTRYGSFAASERGRGKGRGRGYSAFPTIARGRDRRRGSYETRGRGRRQHYKSIQNIYPYQYPPYGKDDTGIHCEPTLPNMSVHSCQNNYFENQQPQQNYRHIDKSNITKRDTQKWIITEQFIDFSTKNYEFNIYQLSPDQFTKDNASNDYYLPFQGANRDQNTRYTFVLGKGITNEQEEKYNEDDWGNDQNDDNPILVELISLLIYITKVDTNNNPK